MLVKFLLIGFAFLTFLRFSVALRKNFDSVRLPLGMILLSALALASFLLISLFAFWSASGIYVVVGLVGIAGSNYIFGKSVSALEGDRLKVAFDPDLPRHVQTTGIYSRIRHPMYASYILFWAAYATGSADWRALLPAFVIISVYVFLALSEERRMLASPASETYAKLMAQAGMFWPKLW
ncbi:MAG: isoprenylcysteine carboxylmethyltransferase family protein [Rhodospirillales bacterium]|nr:MAG: isoprenylcysteine carboxylmethyltransferase family protein [Rhodospirillales bacterium]